MYILLPPSETKRSGGTGVPLDLASLSFSTLGEARTRVAAALAALDNDREATARALALSAAAVPREHERNRTVRSSPTLPAAERYTGVLYDALDVESLSTDARRRVSEVVLVHSALFGLIAADDLIPAYRLSCSSRLPAATLKTMWSTTITDALAHLAGPIIDLRSAGYAALGPLPDRDDAVGVEVVSVGDDGVTRALNHFNKKGKGEWVRVLLSAGAPARSLTTLCTQSTALGWPLQRINERMLQLVVPATLPPRSL